MDSLSEFHPRFEQQLCYVPNETEGAERGGPLLEAAPTESDRRILPDLVRFGQIRSDLVGFGPIRSDSV